MRQPSDKWRDVAGDEASCVIALSNLPRAQRDATIARPLVDFEVRLARRRVQGRGIVAIRRLTKGTLITRLDGITRIPDPTKRNAWMWRIPGTPYVVDASAAAKSFDASMSAYLRGVGWAVNAHAGLARAPNATFVRGHDGRVWAMLTRDVDPHAEIVARYRL